MKTLIIIVLFAAFCQAQSMENNNYERATFAGGCFWCMEAPFEKIDGVVDVVSGFSFMPHFTSMQRGVMDLRDIIYYLSVIFFMLFANAVVLQNRRAS